MNDAFDRAWQLLKAEQDFITTNDPEHVARKRAWLYEMEFRTNRPPLLRNTGITAPPPVKPTLHGHSL